MKMTNIQKGIAALVAGIILLLNSFNAGGQILNIIVMIAALGLMAIGFVIADGMLLVQRISFLKSLSLFN